MAEGLVARGSWAFLEAEPAGLFHQGSPPLLDLFFGLSGFSPIGGCSSLPGAGILGALWRRRGWESALPSLNTEP